MTYPYPSRTYGVQTKIARAHEHLNILYDSVTEIVKSQPNHVSHNFDPNTLEHVWRFETDPPPIPARINAILGDVIYNYRSALDHLVWSLVSANGETPTRANEFPIFIDAPEFQKQCQRKLRGVSTEVKDIISSAQPCNGGHQPLWLLQELSNTDKHRYMPLVFVNVANIDIRSLRIPPKSTVTVTVNRAPLERGAKIIRVVHDDVDVNFQPRFSVAFGEAVPAEDNDIFQVFEAISKAVASVINNLFPHITR